MPKFKAMEGRLKWYCLDYWSTQLNLDMTSLKAKLAGLIAVLPHVEAFLEYLRAHPKSLALKMERSCSGEFFDRIVSSYTFGLPNDPPGVFFATRGTGAFFSSRRTVLIDDNLLRSEQRNGIAHTIALLVLWNDAPQPARVITEFPAITDFRDLMP